MPYWSPMLLSLSLEGNNRLVHAWIVNRRWAAGSRDDLYIYIYIYIFEYLKRICICNTVVHKERNIYIYIYTCIYVYIINNILMKRHDISLHIYVYICSLSLTLSLSSCIYIYTRGCVYICVRFILSLYTERPEILHNTLQY